MGMFTVVDAGGIRTPYVPGMLPPRKVVKVSKTVNVKQVKSEERPFPSDNVLPRSAPHAEAYEQVVSFTESAQLKILARDQMSSPVVTLPFTATLGQAWDLVHAKRFRHIPIVSSEESLVGILSDRDLLRGTVDATLLGFQQSKQPLTFPIRDLVSHPVLVATPEAEVRAIARMLLEERVGAMPVVGETGELVGIITRSDILRILVSHPDFDEWV